MAKHQFHKEQISLELTRIRYLTTMPVVEVLTSVLGIICFLDLVIHLVKNTLSIYIV